jgi:hypothetical protein
MRATLALVLWMHRRAPGNAALEGRTAGGQAMAWAGQRGSTRAHLSHRCHTSRENGRPMSILHAGFPARCVNSYRSRNTAVHDGAAPYERLTIRMNESVIALNGTSERTTTIEALSHRFRVPLRRFFDRRHIPNRERAKRACVGWWREPATNARPDVDLERYPRSIVEHSALRKRSQHNERAIRPRFGRRRQPIRNESANVAVQWHCRPAMGHPTIRDRIQHHQCSVRPRPGWWREPGRDEPANVRNQRHCGSAVEVPIA